MRPIVIRAWKHNRRFSTEAINLSLDDFGINLLSIGIVGDKSKAFLRARGNPTILNNRGIAFYHAFVLESTECEWEAVEIQQWAEPFRPASGNWRSCISLSLSISARLPPRSARFGAESLLYIVSKRTPAEI